MTLTARSVLPSDPRARAPSAARLAAEALFAAAPVSGAGDRSQPQVLVKRRRRLEIDRPDASRGEDGDGDRPDGRTPRTHRLSSPAQPAEGQAPERDAPPSPAARPARRTRKARNGKVTIIRPAAAETAASPGSPGRRGSQPVPAGPASPWLQSLRYPQLLARIRALEQEALALRQREHTVRWIVQAIRSYSLTAADVGL